MENMTFRTFRTFRTLRTSAPRALAALCLALAGCGDDTGGGTSEGDTTSASATEATTGAPTTSSAGPTGSMTSGTGTDATTGGTTSGATTTTDATATTDPTTMTTLATTTDPGTTSTDPGTTSDTGGGVCLQGEVECDGGVAKICDGMGGYEEETPCDDACLDGVGCVLCIPGSTECEGDQVLVCNQQGDGWEPGEQCDAVQGVMCDPDLGSCVGACAPQSLGLSYIGCDYYPTVTPQHDGYHDSEQFAAAVANTTGNPANITITRGAQMITQVQVAPNSVQVIVVPWVDALTDGYGPSKLVVDGSYRLRSDQPVTVYQYNPLTPTSTNDASLLLPVNTWGADYVVASYNTWHFGGNGFPGFYAVTARHDDTEVTLTPSPTGGTVLAGAGVAANGTGVVSIDEGDVLLVASAQGGGGNPDPADLTGTRVTANKDIQVIGGHKCTNVPPTVIACDHLEESLFPVDTLAKEYIVVPPVQVPNNNLKKGQIVRVVATEDDTTLTFDPPQPAPGNIAMAGQFVELSTTTESFVVSSDKKIMVVQYMVGQAAGYGNSDPAMLQAVATEQYRDQYLFHAPTGYQANFVDIIAPDSASVSVDGMNVGGWEAIGNTGFSVAHVQLMNINQGNHDVSADAEIGISVYGVQSYGTYWYPGGLNLNLIPQ
ncbi:MAG: IgGFc-binding protein [Myxococcales bacterium]|nr:IgGFc-binding protein [Myxococcales bacterium]